MDGVVFDVAGERVFEREARFLQAVDEKGNSYNAPPLELAIGVVVSSY